MAELTTVSGYVPLRPASELEDDRYQFITLDQTEPNLGVPDSDGSLVISDIDGTRSFTTQPRLSGLNFKANSLDEVPGSIPQYFLVLKEDPTDTKDDSVGWTLGQFEEVDTLDTVTTRGNVTANSITIANLTADSAVFLQGVTIRGDLTVSGTRTIVNSTEVTIDDINITLADGAPDLASTNGAGITVFLADAQIAYNATTDRWGFNRDIDISRAFVDSAIVFDGASDGLIHQLQNQLNIRTPKLSIRDEAGLVEFAEFLQDNITLNEILTVTDSANMQGKIFATNVPPKDNNTKILFRRQSDGLVMEGEIDVGNVDKIKTEDTDSDAPHYLVFTYANNGQGGFDSAYIDASTLTYNPFTNLLTTENLQVTGFTDLDSTDVVGDLQIRSQKGRLLDSAGRSFVVYDSAGNLLWGNNGVSAGNTGGPAAAFGNLLNDLGDVVINNVQDGHVIKYNVLTNQWENAVDIAGAGGAGIALTDLDAETLAADIGSTGSLSYNSLTGMFTYKPTDISSLALSADVPTILSDLTDVSPTAPSDGDVLKWNETSSIWEPGFVSGGGGGGSALAEIAKTTNVKNFNDYGSDPNAEHPILMVARVTTGVDSVNIDPGSTTGITYNPLVRRLSVAGSIQTVTGYIPLVSQTVAQGGGQPDLEQIINPNGNYLTRIDSAIEATFSHDVQARKFIGDGSLLTGITATPSGLGRVTTSVTATSVIPNANSTITFSDATLGTSYLLYTVDVNAAARVRIYSSAAAAAADITRPSTQDPAEGSGLIAEFQSTTADTYKITPAIAGYIEPAETGTSVTVTNLGASTTSIQVTITALRLETP